MIQFVEHKNINKKKWNDCIDNSLNHSVSAYSWYLDIVCKNWSALILDDYQAVFPLSIKSKYKIKYLLQPLFIRCLGIYSKNKLSEELVNKFIDSIPENIKLIDFHLKENIPFKRADFTNSERVIQLLDLQQPYASILKSYNRSVFKNLKKSEKNELVLVNDVSAETIAELYQANIGEQVSRLSAEDFKTIENVMIAAIKNKCGITIGVKNKKNEIIGSAFFMIAKGKVYFSFGSANLEGKASGAMYLMIDEIIKRYSQQCEIMDFEGSDIKGIADFNRNFGAKDFVYLQVKKNRLPAVVKWVSGKS